LTSASLVDTILWLEDLFDRIGLRRSYGGAIAYNFYGTPRLTRDVDVLVLLPDTRIPALVEALAAEGCRREDGPAVPIDPRDVLADLRGRAHLTSLILRGVRVEIFVPWHPFHHRVLERSPKRELAGREIRIHSAEDLIVFKKVFDRPMDIADIRAMVLAQKGRLDLDRIRSDARLLLTPAAQAELEALLVGGDPPESGKIDPGSFFPG
jgi:hypothetical protein